MVSVTTTTPPPIEVWLPVASGQPLRLAVGFGDVLVFGRGGAAHPVRLRLDHPEVSRTAGQIRAVEDYWTISNFSRTATYVIDNPEGAGEFVKVPPGRLDMPVPFEFATVSLVPGTPSVGFQVIASQHAYAESNADGTASSDATTAAYHLDTTSRYFLVLVALCEPRLRDPASTVLPTAGDVVRRLAGIAPDLTVDAVHAHIKYLVDSKLRLRPSRRALREGNRERLVALALRFDLVREEHLVALERPAPRI